MRDNMKPDTDSPDRGALQSQLSSAPDGRIRLDRRTLLRAGASSAPVLLTLASGPVAANTCVVASSFVSVATFKSRNPTTTTVQCTSRTCEDWRQQAGLATPPACLSPTVSAGICNTSSYYNGMTLRDVMLQGAGISKSGELGVLQHLIALNLCVTQGYAGTVGNLSSDYLKSVWANYKSNNDRYKLPTSGINWDSTKLIGWMRYLLYPYTL